ncbi:rhodanese-related sulfurtransferase/uncharacterized protein (UPF0305 family) [Peptoniphilus olsenii]|uniref:Rhodanese-related sulfurtransferase/uncharacterized protein (UPF0305 family) n=1 Tax=Peptoniphilus olsenii TaxID=411570 RepID=A0ABV2JA89_9FIRM
MIEKDNKDTARKTIIKSTHKSKNRNENNWSMSSKIKLEKDKLINTIADAKRKAMQDDLFTKDSIENLKYYINLAENNLEKATIQKDIDVPYKKLVLAINNLKIKDNLSNTPKSSTNALKEKINIAELKTKEISKYTHDSIENLIKEIEKAKILLEKNDITKTEVEGAIKMLDSAMNNLKTEDLKDKPSSDDEEVVADKIAILISKEKEYYIGDSVFIEEETDYNYFDNPSTNSIQILVNNKTLKQEDFLITKSEQSEKSFLIVKSSVFAEEGKYSIIIKEDGFIDSKLEINIKNPPEEINLDNLLSLLEETTKYSKDNYTKDSFDALQNEILKSKALIEKSKEDLKQKEIDEQENNLKSAIDNLKEKEDDNDLNINLSFKFQNPNIAFMANAPIMYRTDIADATVSNYPSNPYGNDNYKWDKYNIEANYMTKISDKKSIGIRFEPFDYDSHLNEHTIKINGEKIDTKDLDFIKSPTGKISPVIIFRPTDVWDNYKDIPYSSEEINLELKSVIDIEISLNKKENIEDTGNENDEELDSLDDIYVYTDLSGRGYKSYKGEIDRTKSKTPVFGDFRAIELFTKKNGVVEIDDDIDVFDELAAIKGFTYFTIEDPDLDEDELQNIKKYTKDEIKNLEVSSDLYKEFITPGEPTDYAIKVVAHYDKSAEKNIGFVKSVSTNQAYSMIKNNYFISNEKQITVDNLKVFDVRTDGEFDESRLAVKDLLHKNWLSPKDEFENYLSKLNKQDTYLLYCRTQSRSKEAAEFMHSKGFKKIYFMDGGITKWLNEDKKDFTFIPENPLAFYLNIIGEKPEIAKGENIKGKVTLTNTNTKKQV